MIILIQNAEYIQRFRIKFMFSDGAEKIIDFSRFLNQAKNPMTRKYQDEELFKSFSIVYGDIAWNDYEMCFTIRDLYEGKI